MRLGGGHTTPVLGIKVLFSGAFQAGPPGFRVATRQWAT
jgi:hypothetical protein